MRNSKRNLLDLNEQEWLETGNSKCFNSVYTKQRKILRHYLIKKFKNDIGYDDLQDILSETLTRLYQNREDIRQRYNRVALNTWIITVGTNLCLDLLRARQNYNIISINQLTTHSNSGSSSDNMNDEKEFSEEEYIYNKIINIYNDIFTEQNEELMNFLQKMERFIEQLPTDQRNTFIDKFIHNRKYKDIASENRVSENVVKSKAFLAKTKIKDYLMNDYQELFKN
jgi:RNA polymerase sigma factor (sigma-70 family)